jgi:uncharacterized protein YlaI
MSAMTDPCPDGASEKYPLETHCSRADLKLRSNGSMRWWVCQECQHRVKQQRNFPYAKTYFFNVEDCPATTRKNTNLNENQMTLPGDVFSRGFVDSLLQDVLKPIQESSDEQDTTQELARRQLLIDASKLVIAGMAPTPLTHGIRNEIAQIEQKFKHFEHSAASQDWIFASMPPEPVDEEALQDIKALHEVLDRLTLRITSASASSTSTSTERI